MLKWIGRVQDPGLPQVNVYLRHPSAGYDLVVAGPNRRPACWPLEIETVHDFSIERGHPDHRSALLELAGELVKL